MADCLEVLDLSTEVKALTETEPERAGHWQLFLETITDLDDATVDARAVVDFVQIDCQFGGQTRLDFLVNGDTQAQVPVDIEGQVEARSAMLNVHVNSDDMNGVFECRAVATGTKDTYEGTWFMACMDPVGCGCSGSTGVFELTRIEA